METVSIIIPAYNSEKHIKETILSALNQTWRKKEVIIVDDGSTDKTYEVAKTFDSSNVNVIKQENQGACVARNFALSRAQGDYIQWLDSDDLLAPDKIEKQLRCKTIASDKTILLSAAFSTFFYRYWKCRPRPNSLWLNLHPVEWFLNKFSNDDSLFTAVWLVTRKLTDEAGRWNENLSLNDDGEYFGRTVSIAKNILFVSNSMCFYRQANRSSLSRRRDRNAYESLYSTYKLLCKYLLTLENSERSRYAALKYLQSNYIYFYDGPPDIREKIVELARCLGGKLVVPEVGGKFKTVKNVLGYTKSKGLADFIRGRKEQLMVAIDEGISNLPF